MQEIAEDFALKFDIVPGRAPSLDAVTAALSAWSDIIQTAAQLVDPSAIPSVQLIGVEPGSQIFRVSLRKAQSLGEVIVDGAAEYPIPARIAVALSSMIVGGLITAGIQMAAVPNPRIPADQMETFETTNKLLEESVDLQRKNMQFFGVMQEDPAFSGVKVLNGVDHQILSEVPRSEFAARAGVWTEGDEHDKPQEQVQTVTWDVTLLKPVLIAEPRRWVFAKDGLKFSALMADKNVLQAIHDKTLPIQVAEGISMKIQMQYKERYDGNAWVPIDSTRRIARVLYPVPPTSAGPLFSNPN